MHPLGSTSSYPSLLAGTVWSCSDLFVPPTSTRPEIFAHSETSPSVDVNVVKRANCTGALIIDSSQQVVKIPWQEEEYPSLPHPLNNTKGVQIKNTLVVCGTAFVFEDIHVLCFRGTLPQCKEHKYQQLCRGQIF